MNRQDKNYQKLYQYSIRKRNWGVGSVVVGIFLAGMLQAPTVLANTGATASEPTIENQADTGGGAEGGSEAAQPIATTPAPAAATPAPTPAPAESTTPGAETPAETPTSAPNLQPEDTAIAEPQPDTTSTTPYTSVGSPVIIEVSNDEFVLTGNPTHYQTANNRSMDNLINGDPGDNTNPQDDYVVAELAWSGRSLPEAVTFTFNTAEKLDHMLIHRRINNNGTLKKYRVEVFADNSETPASTEEITITNPQANEREVYSLSSHEAVKKVRVTFLEAVNGSNQRRNNTLTIKEITFFKESTIRGELVDSSTLVASGDSAAYQGNRGVSNLIDGKFSTLTETKWDDSHRNNQTITIRKNDNGPLELTGLVLYKRSGGNGSLTKYAVTTRRNGAEVQSFPEVSVARLASLSSLVLDGREVDEVEIRVLEVRNRNDGLENHDLTLREVKLFQRTPQPENPQPENPQPENPQPENPQPENPQPENPQP
ncbi:TPA: YSIRK-type signal peptide-containing protein, partial [Streptococcus suis]|nr:YSIRK-type signal peptide-containing protein [Streptococcus suis]